MNKRVVRLFKLYQNSIKSILDTPKSRKVLCIRKITTVRETQNPKAIGPYGWFLLVIPVSSFSLGVWQIQRKKWKEDLIYNLKQKTTSDPIELPDDLEDLKQLEYRPVHVRGTFSHDKELYIGLRSLLVGGDASTKSSLVSNRGSTTQGYLVITPLKLEDRDDEILVNRGWVPVKYKDPKSRQGGQVSGVVDVIGVVRSHENRPNFAPKNQEGSNVYFYRDLQHMCAVTGSIPIFLDATNDCDVPNGPIGGQTRISLRNEHMSYILTWFSLSGATSYMWYRKFLK